MSMPAPAKYESRTSVRSVFSWTFPGAPIRINIPIDLISRLKTELGQRENAANGKPSAEVGGVLIGHHETLYTLDIDDYVLVPSDERPGSQYHLDPSKLTFLRSVYTIVGYFRTQSENTLHLRDDEISFVQRHFRDSTNVVLLIQTSSRPYRAGFLFWMKEDVFTPISFKEFFLDAELTGSLSPRIQEEETVLPPPPTTDSRATGAVEFASTSSDEESLSALVEDVRMRVRSNLERLRGWSLIWATSFKNALMQISPRMLVVAGGVFSVLVLAGLSAFILKQHGLSESVQKSVTAVAFPLQLNVEVRSNGVNLWWNPQSILVTQAREGRLLILEGDQRPRIIPFNPQQLTSGHVYYRSSAERIQFQLEIVSKSGKVSEESVLALSFKQSPGGSRVTPTK